MEWGWNGSGVVVERGWKGGYELMIFMWNKG